MKGIGMLRAAMVAAGMGFHKTNQAKVVEVNKAAPPTPTAATMDNTDETMLAKAHGWAYPFWSLRKNRKSKGWQRRCARPCLSGRVAK